MTRPKHFPRETGSALISTLLMIVVLTIIVTAFMQSMAVERRTASSYKNKLQAELAAEAGATKAINTVSELFQRYPDSATAWIENLADGTLGATVFYFRSIPVTLGYPAAFPPSANATDDAGLELFAVPLTSKADSVVSADKIQLAPGFNQSLTVLNSTNLNANGAIDGRKDASGQYRRLPVLWVNILKNPAQAEQPDPAKADYNPIVARYAYLVDDESFKFNLLAASTSPPPSSFQGARYSEIELSQLLKDSSLELSFDPTDQDKIVAAVATHKGFGDSPARLSSSLNQLADHASFAEELNFVASEDNGALNLSRGGVKRLALNKAVKDSNDPSEVRRQLDKIVNAISNKNAMPDFGQRFYRDAISSASLPSTDVLNDNKLVGTDRMKLYVERIAANIRDYIDTDHQPTMVKGDDFTVALGTEPDVDSPVGFDAVGSTNSPNEYAAIGKEAVPSLFETLSRVKLFKMNPPVKGKDDDVTEADYEFTFDYYFQFWNPTTKDITLQDLGPGAFLQISNQLPWDTGGALPAIPGGRPYEIQLSDVQNGSGEPLVFRAGTVTVITTDDMPSKEFMKNLAGQDSAVFRPNSSAMATINGDPLQVRRIKGKTKRVSNDADARETWAGSVPGVAKTNLRAFRVNTLLGSATAGRSGSSGNNDHSTTMIIGNDDGMIESFSAISMPNNLSVNYDTKDRMSVPSSQNEDFFFRGASLRGNNGAGGQRGDPRSLNEPIEIRKHQSPSDEDQYRFFQTKIANNKNLETTTFGKLLGDTFFNPTAVYPRGWPDPYAKSLSQNGAPSIVADAPIKNLGELGNVYDPTRRYSSGFLTNARGGGTTLRVGSSDKQSPLSASTSTYTFPAFGLWDGSQISASRNWASWRVADVFSLNEDIQLKGVINPNSVGRASAAALKAALRRLKPSDPPTGDAQIGITALSDDQLDAIIASMRRYQGYKESSPGEATLDPNEFRPIWEPGEIGELDVFARDSPNSLFVSAGSAALSLNDRAVEEFAGRLMGLISPKGNTFTIYSVGQSVRQLPNGNVTGQGKVRMKTTIRITPEFSPPLPADDQNAAATIDRFRQPDKMLVEILQQSRL